MKIEKLTDEQIGFIIERLKEGKREVELGYFGKENISIISYKIMVGALRGVNGFGEIKNKNY